jgi:acyl-CoA thioesterase FadM
MKEHEFKVQDAQKQMGVVYHGNYAQYFFEMGGRVEWLGTLGFP